MTMSKKWLLPTQRRLLVTLLAGASMILAQVPTRAQPSMLEVDIEAQPLPAALEQLADQTGLQVMYFSAVAEGLESAGYTGTGTVEEIVRALLQGSGLEGRFDNAKAISVVPIEQAASGGAAPEASKPEEFVETIIVTAQKREAKLSEVPASIMAFDANALAEAGIVQVQELSDMAPNFQLQDHGGDFQNRATIRGVGSESRNIGFDTRVGVYLDGVYLGQAPAVNADLLDLERIELLRGPQGTLYGKNSIAGALNLVTTSPSAGFSGNIWLKGGEFSRTEASAMLNGSLSERVTGRISVLTRQQDGYVRNTNTGTDLSEQDGTSYRAQLLFTPSDSVSVRATFDGLEADRAIVIGEPLTDPFAVFALNATPFEVGFTFDPQEEKDLFGAAVNVEKTYEQGGVLRSITGYRDSSVFYRNDTDYSVLDFIRIDYEDSYRQLSQEFQWLSPQSSSLSYVLGAYLYKQEGETFRTATSGPAVVFLGPPQLTGLFPGAVINNAGTVDTESYALFGEGKWLAGDRSTLNFGVRLSNEEKRVDWDLDGSRSGIFNIGVADIDDRRSATNVSPAISWTFRASESTNLYLRAATGFKSGGFNLDFITPGDLQAGIEFDDETVVSFEAGLKVTAMGGRLLFNLAAFNSEYDDYQVNQFLDLGNGGTSITIRNAAEVSTQGVEADLTYRGPNGLELTASLGLLDTEFTEFPGGGIGGTDASGNELPYAPENSFSFGIGKIWQIGGPVIVARASYSHTAAQFTSPANVSEQPLATGGSVPFGRLDAYDVTNARLGLISKSGKFELYLWGRNLTDEIYVLNTNRDFFGTVTEFRARPRTLGAELIFNF
ncbi:MAG: TonB-dependent receptor [Acidobacteriota bacterium]